ncbi:uncharacterized protein LOC112097892 [Citrus clementina]|uniref:uncharacterized protein LOC112097892 n=1 Tax=Citrus clementina TaxID=85681 RepID=UPI000CED27CD|nr:uncharacterized protein LOC112097892 [Citrus x clementina]
MIAHDLKTFGVYWESRLDEQICNEVIEFTELSNSVLEIWIRHLYEEMDNGSGVIRIQFGCIAKLQPSQASYPNRCSYISDLLDKIQIAQIIVFPYNPGGHWVLVTIGMVRRKSYYLDPLGDNLDDELKQMVNDGITMHQVKSNKKKAVQWVSVKCPKQPGTFECGYYVMKYIQDIVRDLCILENNFKGCNEYTMDDLSQLRDQWAMYVAKLLVAYNNEVGKVKGKAKVKE